MKHLILLAAANIYLVACTSSGDKQNTGTRQNDDNIELVKNYIKAVENLDYNAMSNYLGDNYIGMGPSYGDSIRKEQAVENWKANATNLYEKIQYNRSRFASVSIPDGDNKGDWVANWAELNIHYKNGGGPITIWANTNYLIEDGKIVKSLTFYNEADALRQLGYEFTPPEQSK
ncbi:nuclear transport factor 2 family protein [Pontibacter sp. KCTC 32443]|uniref:nuclear transport factor 2 family protein n=1 Tax=Pontibacter TaxID=323449 RepID=UPI00164E4A2E|nr:MULTISPECIES: nuclear transport factor 2 family protein [Pontibacter]MBC5773644.1 nuclear transport factor 2 family protein [Pontibacter sp. KCTC 32443]